MVVVVAFFFEGFSDLGLVNMESMFAVGVNDVVVWGMWDGEWRCVYIQSFVHFKYSTMYLHIGTCTYQSWV